MAIKTFTTGEVLTASDTNTYLANSGLVYIKTATVTNQTSTGTTWQSVFSSSFDSYRLVINSITAHTNGSIPKLTFFYGVSTEQITTYYSGVINAYYNGTTTVTNTNNGANISLGASCANEGVSTYSIDFHQCGSLGRANVLIQGTDTNAGGFGSGGGYCYQTRTYDGFKLFMSAGNISMTGTLYGYRKA